MDLRQLFATNLRRLRHSRGISQEQLANDAGIDRAYVSRVERAVTYVGLEIIGKLSTILGVEPAEFFQRPSKRSVKRQSD
ncbi:helix-turn-helix transcriptional regulator [Bradyrhizobium sp. B117]|uniref:helix-turn-helix domain-containing protein n=1 Tax=Bradyrhizobium sp. B117 TaxID=3140246 RepID=UPI0031836028